MHNKKRRPLAPYRYGQQVQRQEADEHRDANRRGEALVFRPAGGPRREKGPDRRYRDKQWGNRQVRLAYYANDALE